MMQGCDEAYPNPNPKPRMHVVQRVRRHVVSNAPVAFVRRYRNKTMLPQARKHKVVQ
jgi:hypothetical protein